MPGPCVLPYVGLWYVHDATGEQEIVDLFAPTARYKGAPSMKCGGVRNTCAENREPVRKNPDLVELGRNIQAWREVAGMTQEKLGLEIGADKGKISRYESGQMAMKVDRLFQVAEALQVPLEELCPSWLCDRKRIDPRLFRLSDAIQKLPEDKRTALFQATEAMAIGFRTAD